MAVSKKSSKPAPKVSKKDSKDSKKDSKQSKKKVVEPSSSSSSSDSDSDSDSSSSSEEEVEAKPTKSSKKKVESSSSSSSSSSDSEEEPAKKPAAKKAESSSDSSSSSSSSSSSDEEEEVKKPAKKAASSSSSSDSSSDSSADEKGIKKEAKKASSGSDSDSDSDSGSSSSSSSSSDEEEAPSKKRKADDSTAVAGSAKRLAPNDFISVFIKGLPYSLNNESLQQTLEEHGLSPYSVRVITNPGTGDSRGFGYADFTTKADADKCLEATDIEVSGRYLSFHAAEPRAQNNNRGEQRTNTLSEPSTTLFLANLPRGNPDDVKDTLLEKFDKFFPSNVRVISDRETGEMKGFGYIELDTVENATSAINELNGNLVLDGRTIRIDFSGKSTTNNDNNRGRGGFRGGRGGSNNFSRGGFNGGNSGGFRGGNKKRFD